MKKLLTFAMAIIFAMQLWAQTTVIVGDTTATTQDKYLPANTYYKNSYSQSLYPTEQIQPGLITSISYYHNAAAYNVGTVSIYMKEATETSLTSTFLPTDGFIEVYSGALNLVNGWVTYELTTPFVYTGGGNLVVLFIRNATNYENNHYFKYAAGIGSSVYKQSDTEAFSIQAPPATGTALTYVPVTKFEMTPLGEDFCYPVSDVETNIGSTEATISWTSESSNFTIQCKLQSEDWDSENVQEFTSTTPSITLTDLLPATFYTVRIKAICDENESVWRSLEFKTNCTSISDFPWVETFETAWLAPYLPGTISAPNCWINVNADNNSTYCTKTTTTGYQGSGVYMYGYSSSTSTSTSYANKDWFISPVIELTGEEMLAFYAKKSGSSYTPELRIYALDVETYGDFTSQADTVNFVLIDSLLDLTTTYAEREILLTDLEGQYRLAFVRNRTIGHGSVYIDNVKVGLTPTCERVTNFTATEITETSISFSWEGSEGTDSYKLYYKTSTATDWTVIEDVTENNYTFTDLQIGTPYLFNITAVCDNGAETGFIVGGDLTIATLCQLETAPYLEDFTVYPAGSLTTCWREAQCTWDSVQAGAALYGYSNTWMTYNSYVFDEHAKINNSGTAVRNWLITPGIDLGDGSTEYDLAFDIAYTDYNNANEVEGYGSQKFGVIVSTTGGATWDFDNAILWKVNPTEGTNERNITELTNLPQRIKFNLTELGYTGVVRVAFYAESLVSGNSNDIHLDNVAVQEHIDCGDMVGAPVVSAASTTSVTAYWNTDEHDAATGWVLSYTEGITNDDPATATTVEVPYGTEFPYTIEGLTAGATYAFSVQYDCGGAWSNTAVVTLPESMDIFATIPYATDFEDVEENTNWVITNNSYVNRWFLGHPANVAQEGTMLYVSDTVTYPTGANSTYDNSSAASYVFASRLLQFEEALAYEISFDYYVQGEPNYDFIKVALRPWDESFVGITAAPAWTAYEYLQDGFDYPSGLYKFNQDTTGTARGSIIVDGSVVNNSLQQLVFAWRNDGTGGVMSPVLLDNVSVTPINCIAPDGFSLAEDGRQLTSLTFNISARAGDSWEIQYQEYTDTVWQSVIATDTVGIEIENLLAGNMYRVKARSICDQDTSYFTGELLYQTLCPVITITDEEPFTEGFEVATWFRSGSVTSSSAYAPLCWANVDAGTTSYRWQNASTNPYSGTYAAQIQLTTATAVDWLISPIFDLAGTETLSFYARHTLTNAALQSGVKVMYYSVDENGDMSSAADTALFVNLQDVNLTNEYTPYDVSLASLDAGQYRLAFLVSQTATTGHYIRLDEIQVANISCPRPSVNIAISEITPSTATVSWTDESNTAWNVYYKAEGDTTYQMVSSTETSAELTNLIQHTYYEVYVVASCGEEESEPTLTSTFMTSCDYITELPFFEGFEEVFVTENISNAAAPGCWINLNGGYESSSPTYFWKRTTTASYIHEGAGALYSYGTSTSPGNNDWLITPVISHEGGAMVRFFAKVSSATSTHPNITIKYYDVATHGDVDELADSANFVTIGTINATTTYAEYEYLFADLPETYRLAFVRQDATGVSMYIDNLSIIEIPTCLRPDPASVTVTNVLQNTATVSWTDSDESHTSWTVYYKSADEEEYLSESTTETTLELTDLVSGTAYEVYVVTMCEDGSESDATYTTRFNTLQEPVELPYTCDFEEEGSNGWLLKNGTLVNQWHVGTPAGATSSSLFISGDNGATATYAHSTSVVVAEKLFQLGATDSVRISFDLTVGGESTSDYLKVFWVPADTVYLPATSAYFANTTYGNGALMNNYVPSYSTSTNYYIVRLVTGTQNMSVTLENNPNELRKLVFVWKNDGSLGTQPGAIIDNVVVEPIGEEVTCAKPVATSVVASDFTTTSAVISWTDNDETHTAWNVYYKVVGAEDYEMIPSAEQTLELTGLATSELYEVYVTTNCGSEESDPTDVITFTTLQEPIDLPYTCDFEEEGANGWLIKNGACTNKWYVGTLAGTENSSLFITNDNGNTAGYTLNAPGVVVAEKLFQLGDSDSIRISFDLTVGGEATYDYLKVYWLPVDTVYEAVSGSTYPYYGVNSYQNGIIMNNYTGTSNYRFLNLVTDTNVSVTLPNNPNELRKLVFVWKNDISQGTTPGAIIDNVVVEEATEQGGTDPEPEPCDAPTDLTVSNITENSADVSWNGTADTYEIRLNGGATETVTTTSKQLIGLPDNFTITVEVRAVCGEQQSEWVSTTFTTLAVTDPEPEPCDAPTGLTVSNITETSADITWNGTATTYEFKLNGGTAETLTTTTKALTGLTANTAYTVEVRAICGEQQSAWVSTTFTTLEEEVEIIAPVVTTLAATAVDHESAVLNGTITAGNETITAQGFKYKAATATEWTEAPAIGTTLIISINGLTAETTYTFKAFATTASGTVEGAELTFTTLAIPVVVVAGEVTTTPATEVGNTSATLNGTLVSAGNSENFTVGFALSTTADFTLEDANVQNIVATVTDATFSQAVTDLVEGQTYFFRAYITNEAGTAYGAVETFTLSGLADAMANSLEVSLYPNPAQEVANIEINGLNQEAKIVISDLQGRILSQDTISAGTSRYTINVSNFASGVYYIRIVTDAAISTQKLIVE